MKTKIPSHSLAEPKEFHVYVLECEGGRYYIGLTGNLDVRLTQHFQCEGKQYPGGGSRFTERYKPIRLVESYLVFHIRKTSGDKPYDEENKLTEEYISLYGDQNVCGGSYCKRFYKKYTDIQ